MTTETARTSATLQAIVAAWGSSVLADIPIEMANLSIREEVAIPNNAAIALADYVGEQVIQYSITPAGNKAVVHESYVIRILVSPAPALSYADALGYKDDILAFLHNNKFRAAGISPVTPKDGNNGISVLPVDPSVSGGNHGFDIFWTVECVKQMFDNRQNNWRDQAFIYADPSQPLVLVEAEVVGGGEEPDEEPLETIYSLYHEPVHVRQFEFTLVDSVDGIQAWEFYLEDLETGDDLREKKIVHLAIPSDSEFYQHFSRSVAHEDVLYVGDVRGFITDVVDVPLETEGIDEFRFTLFAEDMNIQDAFQFTVGELYQIGIRDYDEWVFPQHFEYLDGGSFPPREIRGFQIRADLDDDDGTAYIRVFMPEQSGYLVRLNETPDNPEGQEDVGGDTPVGDRARYTNEQVSNAALEVLLKVGLELRIGTAVCRITSIFHRTRTESHGTFESYQIRGDILQPRSPSELGNSVTVGIRDPEYRIALPEQLTLKQQLITINYSLFSSRSMADGREQIHLGVIISGEAYTQAQADTANWWWRFVHWGDCTIFFGNYIFRVFSDGQRNNFYITSVNLYLLNNYPVELVSGILPVPQKYIDEQYTVEIDTFQYFNRL